MLVLLSTIAKAQSDFHVTTRRMYVASAETQDYDLFVDNIYRSFARWLDNSDRYVYVPLDSMQRYLGQVFLSDFVFKFDQVQLLNARKKFNLDIFLFFYLEKAQNEYHLHVKAVEFPSNVFIGDLDFKIDLNVDDIPQILNSLQTFVETLRRTQDALGYSFHESENGILFLADDLHSPRLHRLLRAAAGVQSELREYQKIGLRFKVYARHFPDWPPANKKVDSLLQQTNAKVLYLIRNDSSDIRVHFPLVISDVSIVDNTLPLWPPYAGFKSFSVEPDTSYGYDLANSLYPQPYGAISELLLRWRGRGDPARSLFLKNIQTIQESHADLTFDDKSALSELYDALAELYPNVGNELGWIHLNHADVLKQMNDLDASLTASQAALNNFQHTSLVFGQLFALVQSADIFEQQDRLEDAERNYINALALAQQLEDEATTAHIYFRLGSIEFDQDKLIEAWEYFDSSAEGYLSIGDTLKVVQLNTKLGILMRQSAFSKKSSEYLQRAVRLAHFLDNDRELADASYHLAVTLKERDETDKALQYFQDAGDLLEILADTLGLANAEEHIGDILFARQQWRPAQSHYEYAARFYKYVPDIEGFIRSSVKAADAAVNRQRWLRAHTDYDEALQYAKLYDKTEWASIIIYKKGLAHVREGKYALGQEELEMARQENVSQEDIDAYMQSFIRELEQELQSRRETEE